MRRVMSWLLVLLVGGALALATFWALRPEPVLVEVAEVSCGPMQVTVDVEGRTRVRDRFVISAPITGRVRRIVLKEGDRLKVGDIIARLTPAPSDLRTIRTNQAAARAADAQRRASESVFERALVTRDQARRDRARVDELAANGIASPHELEQAIMAQKDAEKAYDAALFAAQAAAFGAEEAESALLSAYPEDPSEDALISQVLVRSPIAGRVLHVVQTSERVVNAGDPLVELADRGLLELVFETLSVDFLAGL